VFVRGRGKLDLLSPRGVVGRRALRRSMMRRRDSGAVGAGKLHSLCGSFIPAVCAASKSNKSRSRGFIIINHHSSFVWTEPMAWIKISGVEDMKNLVHSVH
jgi:hypothetical protein